MCVGNDDIIQGIALDPTFKSDTPVRAQCLHLIKFLKRAIKSNLT